MEMQESKKCFGGILHFSQRYRSNCRKDAEHLIFENEHQLGIKTKRNRCFDHQRIRACNPEEYQADFSTT